MSGEFIVDVATHLVLPALTIVLVSIGGWMLGMRNTMIATRPRTTSRWPRPRACDRRGSCCATPPATRCCPRSPTSAWPLGFVVGGALLTEVVFAYPGVGYQLLTAVHGLDYPLMQGIFLTITVAVLVANFLVDIVYVRLDPRVRVG